MELSRKEKYLTYAIRTAVFIVLFSYNQNAFASTSAISGQDSTHAQKLAVRSKNARELESTSMSSCNIEFGRDVSKKTGGIGINLKGRAVVVPPKLPNNLKEDGKVVVEITVDKEGNVIEANPEVRGTTTTSKILKEKARQIAMATKFNTTEKSEEQNGTITIIFSFD